MNAEQGSAQEFFDAATTIEVEEKRPSMFYSVLPAMVQDRIPTLPSIRRALGDMRSSSKSFNMSRNASEVSLPRSPPPGYTSRPISAALSQHSSNRSSLDTAVEDEDLFQEVLSENLASPMSTPPPFTVSEVRTGIKWKYANQGVSLSAQAYAESQCPRVDDTSTILTRQMYIHSLTYLLRGLPSTLSPEETISLQAALPPNLFISAPCDHDLSFPHPDDSSSPPSDPSFLHRTIATLVFETFVLLQFLLPYIKLFLGHAYRFERKHNVAQRLVNTGIMGADAIEELNDDNLVTIIALPEFPAVSSEPRPICGT
ncbi:uncharacterized protein N0V89_000223 [Didymosphaeria variabile]|uniref:Uncharacterized protein n=1 Tax=Didymosphaeria variabile TaxID=1932322 RepID=A0A9W8XWD3_9PLEO|nr:uncharacterized protein N0V89_000223 [Didymosphaeria variabile]KAJ4359667.1 hypothetical protein N0V89_000223 [Didymosphaeria variabile]